MSTNARLTRSASSCERDRVGCSPIRNVGSEPATAELVATSARESARQHPCSAITRFGAEAGGDRVGERTCVRRDLPPNLRASAIPAAIRS